MFNLKTDYLFRSLIEKSAMNAKKQYQGNTILLSMEIFFAKKIMR